MPTAMSVITDGYYLSLKLCLPYIYRFHFKIKELLLNPFQNDLVAEITVCSKYFTLQNRNKTYSEAILN